MNRFKEFLKRAFQITRKQQYYYFTFMGIHARIYSHRLAIQSIYNRQRLILQAHEASTKHLEKLLEEIDEQISNGRKTETDTFKKVQKLLKKSDEVIAQNAEAEKEQSELSQNLKLLKEQADVISSKVADIERVAVTHMDFLESCDYVVEPAKLLANQFCGENFDGFDLIIKYLAIANLEGKTSHGIDMYQKMYEVRSLASLYTIERFVKLINSFKERNQYMFDHPIEVDSAGIILDGAHRLACAIYFKFPLVTIRIKRRETKSRNFQSDFFLKNGFSQEEFNTIVEEQKRIFMENGLLISVIFWANTERSAFDFETVLNRSKRFKLVKGMKLYLNECQFQEICRLSKDPTGSVAGLKCAADIFSTGESSAAFYIYWYEVSNSGPVYSRESGRLENHRIKDLQRSLKLNITEDEATRKGSSLWWMMSDDIKFNVKLLSFLRNQGAREIDVAIRRKIYDIFYKQKQQFGRGQLYQSFPLLSMEGQRPTNVRLAEYGTEELLRNNFSVLDIGCNCGFLDLTIAKGVSSVTGIDSNESLIQIGTLAAEHLGIHNVTFTATDFAGWEAANTSKYDVIFSFAVHYWLKTTPDVYSKQLCQILKQGGYIFFESQRLDTIDADFDEYCHAFMELGLRVIRDGRIKDDGIIERRYLIFQK